MISVFSWQNSVSLCPALFCTPQPNLPIIRYLFTSYFCIPVPKGLYSQSYGFSISHVWMWELNHKEGWVPKNWCSWTLLLEKTLESPLDSKEIKSVNPKGNESWMFIEQLMLKLKLQHLGHVMQRTGSLEKSLMLGKIEGKRRRGWQRTTWLDGITNSMDMSLNRVWGMVKDRDACHAAVHEVTKSWKWLSDWKQQQQYNA